MSWLITQLMLTSMPYLFALATAANARSSVSGTPRSLASTSGRTEYTDTCTSLSPASAISRAKSSSARRHPLVIIRT